MKQLKKISDDRGYHAEVFKASEAGFQCKYIHLVTLKPNAIRGNHYHKKRREVLFMLNGRAEIKLKDMTTGLSTKEIMSPLAYVVIEPLTLHTVINVGREDITLFEICDKEFDKNKPDTYREDPKV